MSRALVLYHAHCADGFGAAWAARQALGDAALYRPVRYGADPPVIDSNEFDSLYVLDFSFPRAYLDEVASRMKVRVIDHHVTAQKDLGDCPYALFDMTQSGAVLAWKFFNGPHFVPTLLKYIQDRDLWQFQLPHSREISAGLWSYLSWEQEHDFNTFDNLYRDEDPGIYTLSRDGIAIERYMRTQVTMICDQAYLGNGAVPTVNATSLWSEVGEELLRRYPDALYVRSYYDTKDGLRKWSLRSRKDFDVSKIAAARGGGGHKQAAGYVETLKRE